MAWSCINIYLDFTNRFSFFKYLFVVLYCPVIFEQFSIKNEGGLTKMNKMDMKVNKKETKIDRYEQMKINGLESFASIVWET